MSGLTRDALREALWAWDPIGVAAHRNEAGDEYDDLARRILSEVDREASYAELEATVRRFVEDLGVRPVGEARFLNWLRSVTANDE